jgi:hypothetical protein
VPYVVLTAGYLLLRYLLFHEVARENTLTSLRFQQFVSDSSRHLARLVFGGPGIRPWTARDTGIVSAAAVVLALIAARARHLTAPARWRPGIYFAVCWVALGVAPILVSGYYSPRHVYLASLGWAVALGIAFEIVWTARPARYLRSAAVVGALALLVGYSVQLREVVHGWHVRAIVSRQALIDVEREAVASPEGSLLIVGVPTASWGFAAPHAFRPPFTRSDLTRRVWIVSDSSLHCCAAAQWDGYTRAALDAWRSAPTRRPAVAMSWDSKTARLSRVSDVDDPQLDTLIALLAKTDSRETLDSAIRGLLKNFVAVR